MYRRLFIAATLALGLAAHAQTFPGKTVTMVVPFPPARPPTATRC
jgi:tripartite-type tricarboxylate transporter receptor subunit TctC